MLKSCRYALLAPLTIVLLSLAGCALLEDRSKPPAVYGPREQVFYANFDEVWRSVNVVLQPYPLRVSNMDQGTIETDSIRGDRVWEPPYQTRGSDSGASYSLVLRVIKGKSATKPATKVVVLKEANVQTDFFSDPKQKPSDGLEERTLLYHIGREIQIERALAKAQKKSNLKENLE